MTPADWLITHADLLPTRGHALDVACGQGRHARWLAARGLTVLALDRDGNAVRGLNADAARDGLPLVAEVRDLETGVAGLGQQAFDVIVAVHYLHRPLFPELIAALRPGGLLFYETFTRAQALRGKPTNPAFLLETGELRRLVRSLEIVDYREGTVDDREIASVAARKGEEEEKGGRRKVTPRETEV